MSFIELFMMLLAVIAFGCVVVLNWKCWTQRETPGMVIFAVLFADIAVVVMVVSVICPGWIYKPLW